MTDRSGIGSDPMAEPPIIVNEKGDVELYDDPSDAERDLEPIDVRNEEFTVFDSRGLRLIPTVTEDGLRVRLKDSIPPDYQADQLVAVLRRFLSKLGEDRSGVDENRIWRMALSELVSSLRAAQERGRKRKGILPWRRA